MAEPRSERVVLVDASGSLVRRFGDALDAAGFAWSAVGSAADCLRSVEDERVDAIVAEQELPDLTGLKLLRSVRVSAPTLPFVLAPGEGSERLAGEAMTATANGYVPADAAPETLVSQIGEAFGRGQKWSDPEGDERYRHLVEISPAPINLFDASGESIWCNQAVVDLLGLDSRADLIGESIFKFIHPDDRELAESELRTVIERKQSVGPTRMKLTTQAGDVKHILVSTAVGRFLGSDIGQAVVIDVTPVHDAERELRDEREFIDSALDTLQDVFYVVTPSGEVLELNAAAAEVTGFDPESIVGRSVAAFLADDTVDRVLASIEAVIEEGHDTVEADIVTADGRRIPYEFRGRRFETRDGDVRVVGIGRDISDYYERNRQLRVLEAWLRHNIRNDVNVIQLLAEKLIDDQAEDPGAIGRRIQEYADHLVEQADRERDLVAMLTGPPDPTPTAIGPVVERAVEAARRRYPDADVEYHPAEVHDAMTIPALEEAVDELIGNAVEHNDADAPTVSVAVTEREGNGVTVRVVDNGPGIPVEEREVLFLDREIDQLHHHSGLGLLFSYWVARVSGGRIDIADHEPRGTAIELTLPRG